MRQESEGLFDTIAAWFGIGGGATAPTGVYIWYRYLKDKREKAKEEKEQRQSLEKLAEDHPLPKWYNWIFKHSDWNKDE